MSRSYKKTPVLGNTTAKSNKPFKKIENRRRRKNISQKLNVNNLEENVALPAEKQFGNEWYSPRDGKSICMGANEFRNSYISSYYGSYEEYLREFTKK